jgi:hypothetical protein
LLLAVPLSLEGTLMPITIEDKCHNRVAMLVEHLRSKPTYQRTYENLYKTLLPVMKTEEYADDEAITLEESE